MTIQRPSGPPPVPNNIIAQLRFMRYVQKDLLHIFAGWSRTYGDIHYLRIGNGGQYTVSHPDLFHELLVKQASKFHKSGDYKDKHKGLARFLGNGLVVSDGEFWKRQRRLAQPAFHAQRIGAYAQTIVDYTQSMLNEARWRTGATLDIDQEMMRLTMLIVARVLFNADVSGDAERVGKAMSAVQKATGEFDLMPHWLPTPKHIRSAQAVRVLDEIIYRIIAERRAAGEDRGDLLSMMLMARDADGSAMTDLQARDEAVTLFLAGHDTTSNALTWTWYLLSQHPEIEARLQNEIDIVLEGRPPSLADLERLPYTDMVVKESMRLYPPVWSISRIAIEEAQLGGYTIPKGGVVSASMYTLHHDERWYPDPERFDPERFSAENEKNIQKYAYLPFGGGPRICIGNSFAMMEARLILATIAQRYRLCLEPGHRVEPHALLTLKAKYGMRMRLEMRKEVQSTEYSVQSVRK
jgi:cytochrome P450